jgi:hypothetical protein
VARECVGLVDSLRDARKARANRIALDSLRLLNWDNLIFSAAFFKRLLDD